MGRILCARFPHLGLVAAWRRHPELRAEPVVVGGAPVLRLPVVAASAAAFAAGVRPGQPLRQAQQLCPAAAFVPLDGEAVAHLRAEAVRALWTAAPAVEMGDEEAYADLGGRHAAHAGEPAWAAAVARALTSALGEAPAVGVASSRFVAWLAARASSPHRVRRVREGEEAAFLAPLPIGVLPADPAVLARLAALGLDRLGAVAALSPADLQRQFGPEGLRLLRHARGDDGGGLTPYAPPSTVGERVVLDGAVADLETLRFCARRATGALAARLQERALAAGRLELVLEGEAGMVGSASRVPPLPAAGVDELWPAVLGVLGAVTPTGPVTALRLEAGMLVGVAGRQADLLRRGDADRDTVTRTVARLRDRFGDGQVLRPRLAVDPGDLPERRFVWESGEWEPAESSASLAVAEPAAPYRVERR